MIIWGLAISPNILLTKVFCYNNVLKVLPEKLRVCVLFMYIPPLLLLLTSHVYSAASLALSPVSWSMLVLVLSAVKKLNLSLLDIMVPFCFHRHSNNPDEDTVQLNVIFLITVSSSTVGMITELSDCGSWNVI